MTYLQYLMDQAELSQANLSRWTGINQGKISQILSRKSLPNKVEARKLISFFKNLPIAISTCPALRPRQDLHTRPWARWKRLTKTTNVSSHATTADHVRPTTYQQPYSVSMLPSTNMTASAPTTSIFRGSITQPAHSLSTLRNMGYPNATQDSLPAGGQP